MDKQTYIDIISTLILIAIAIYIGYIALKVQQMAILTYYQEHGEYPIILNQGWLRFILSHPLIFCPLLAIICTYILSKVIYHDEVLNV